MEKEKRLESIDCHTESLMQIKMELADLQRKSEESEVIFSTLNERLEMVCSEITLIVASEDLRESAELENKRRDLEAVAEQLKAAKIDIENKIESLKALAIKKANDLKLEEEELAKLSLSS
jgi:hypothetical protein